MGFQRVYRRPSDRGGFDDSAVRIASFPDELAGDTADQLLAVDGETVLLSVLGGEDLPGIRTGTAIWSSDTGIASALLRLLRSHLGDAVEKKL